MVLYEKPNTMATGETSIFFNPIPPKVTPSDMTPSAITSEDSPEQALEKFKLWCESTEKDAKVNIQFGRLMRYGNEDTALEGLELLKKHRGKVFDARFDVLNNAYELVQ